jgi:asparagine synthase (glutamine-hydrolysing)
MSGIAGIYHFDGRPVDNEINRMMDVMEHRGPDDQGVWTSGPVGMGHCMLHTTPESLHASIPQKSAQSGCVITADARIDNRDALIRDLRLSTDPDRVIPDTTLILRAYEEWGRDCVDHLLGAFSFAIWDPRKNCYFCVQDHFGIRPFYYYYDQERVFAFASEIKALFELEPVPKTLDDVRIAEHLLAPTEDDVTRTYFKHIRRTAPAHTLVADPDSLETRQYWALDPNRTIQLSSDEEYARRFRELFEEAVRVRLRSTHPIGSELSGGLDSSSITCQAAQILRESGSNTPPHTFSIVFNEALDEDEHPYIDSVLEKYDELNPHFIWGDEKSPLAEWDNLYQHLDEACGAPNVYIPLRVNRLAQKNDIRVILSGFDGDTTISHGLGYFYQLRNEKRWIKLVREVASYARRNGESPKGAVLSWIKGPFFSLPGISQLNEARQFVKSLFSEHVDADRGGDEEPAWRRALSSELIEAVQPYLNQEGNSKPSTEREQHYRRLRRPVMSQILYLENHMSSAFSVVNRYPFFDKNLVEFCLALPPNQKIRNGWSRLILRRGMDGILPTHVQWRERKTDYTAQLQDLLLKHEKSLFDTALPNNLGGIERFVSSDFLREFIPHFLDKNIDSSGEGAGLLVWRSLSLSLWLASDESRREALNAPAD